MKKCVIINSAEGRNKLYKELTDEQYEFLNNLFEELNNSDFGECWAPNIYVYEAQDNELKMFQNNDN